jgi:hypothetical protein
MPRGRKSNVLTNYRHSRTPKSIRSAYGQVVCDYRAFGGVYSKSLALTAPSPCGLTTSKHHLATPTQLSHAYEYHESFILGQASVEYLNLFTAGAHATCTLATAQLGASITTCSGSAFQSVLDSFRERIRRSLHGPSNVITVFLMSEYSIREH